MRFPPVLTLVLVAVTLVAAPAAAQPEEEGTGAPTEELGEAERTALARDQFAQGVRFARREQWQQASDRFGRALELRPSPQIRYNLAESLFHLGRLVEASEHVALLEGAEDVPRSVRRSIASLRERIDQTLGRLTLHVDGEGPQTRVTLDGREISPALFDVEMPVDPGRHVVRLAQGDHELESQEVLVPEGGSAALRLEVPAPSPREAALAAEQNGEPLADGATADDDSGGVGPWWLWTTIAVVLVGGGVAAFLLLDGDEDPTQGDFMPGVLEVP